MKRDIFTSGQKQWTRTGSKLRRIALRGTRRGASHSPL